MWTAVVLGAIASIGPALMLGAGLLVLISGRELNSFKPAALLRWEGLNAEDRIATRAIDELVLRTKNGALGAAELDRTVRVALRLQADRDRPWMSEWGEVIEAAQGAGSLGKDDWQTYLDNMYEVSCAVRPRVRAGALIPIRVEVRGPRSAGLSMQHADIINSMLSVRTNGAETPGLLTNASDAPEIATHVTELWSSVMPTGSLPGTLTLEGMLGPRGTCIPGSAVVWLQVRWSEFPAGWGMGVPTPSQAAVMGAGVPLSTGIATGSRLIALPCEVISDLLPAALPIAPTEVSMRNVRRSLESVVIDSNARWGHQSRTLTFDLSTCESPLAFDVRFQSGDRSPMNIGTLTYQPDASNTAAVAKRCVEFTYPTTDSSAPSRLIFQPNARLAEETVEGEFYFDGVIVIEGLDFGAPTVDPTTTPLRRPPFPIGGCG